MAKAASKMAPAPPQAEHTEMGCSPLLHTDDDDDGRESRASSPSPTSQRKASQKDLLAKFDKMLQRALKVTSKQITDHLTHEIRELGHRTAELEIRMDNVTTSMELQDKHISSLRDENLHLNSKLEDLENRSRRSNLRFRGIPENVTDLQATLTAMIQELVPTLPLERLEMERAHRALTRKNPDGPPRDIIVKFLYFRTKEAILQAVRDKPSLEFQGYTYQVFADLAPSTIAKRRELRPFLQILQRHQIAYRWGFPFRLSFTFHGRHHSGTTPSEIRDILRELRLLPADDPDPPASSSKRRHPSSPDPRFSPFHTPRASGKKRSTAVQSMDSDSPG